MDGGPDAHLERNVWGGGWAKVLGHPTFYNYENTVLKDGREGWLVLGVLRKRLLLWIYKTEQKLGRIMGVVDYKISEVTAFHG